jgi:hypothetical protein
MLQAARPPELVPKPELLQAAAAIANQNEGPAWILGSKLRRCAAESTLVATESRFVSTESRSSFIKLN